MVSVNVVGCQLCNFGCCCAAFVVVVVVVMQHLFLFLLLLLLAVSLLLRPASVCWREQMSLHPFVERLSLLLRLMSSSVSPKPISPQIALRSNSFVFNLSVAVLPYFLIIFTLRTRGSLAQRFNSYLLELKNEPSVGHQSLGS